MLVAWSVVSVLVFAMRVRASTAVHVAVGLSFDDVQGVLGMHASEGHPQPQLLTGEASFERPVEGQVREALGEVDVDCGVHDYPDVPGLDVCGWLCPGDGDHQGAQFAIRGHPESGGQGLMLRVVAIHSLGDAHGGTTDSGGVLQGAGCVSAVDDDGVAGYG